MFRVAAELEMRKEPLIENNLNLSYSQHRKTTLNSVDIMKAVGKLDIMGDPISKAARKHSTVVSVKQMEKVKAHEAPE